MSRKDETIPDPGRRNVLAAGIVMPPLMATLLSTTMNSPAIAASGALIASGGAPAGALGAPPEVTPAVVPGPVSGGGGSNEGAPLVVAAVPAAGAAAGAGAGAFAPPIFAAAGGGPGELTPAGFAVTREAAPRGAGPVVAGAPGAPVPAGLRFWGGAPTAAPSGGTTVYPANILRRIRISRAGERG